jgi:hypothetical protein
MEHKMFNKLSYYTRWAMLVGSGAVVFQATGTCWDVAQTGLLAVIAGTTFFIVRNV